MKRLQVFLIFCFCLMISQAGAQFDVKIESGDENGPRLSAVLPSGVTLTSIEPDDKGTMKAMVENDCYPEGLPNLGEKSQWFGNQLARRKGGNLFHCLRVAENETILGYIVLGRQPSLKYPAKFEGLMDFFVSLGIVEKNVSFIKLDSEETSSEYSSADYLKKLMINDGDTEECKQAKSFLAFASVRAHLDQVNEGHEPRILESLKEDTVKIVTYNRVGNRGLATILPMLPKSLLENSDKSEEILNGVVGLVGHLKENEHKLPLEGTEPELLMGIFCHEDPILPAMKKVGFETRRDKVINDFYDKERLVLNMSL
ncbi:MAG: hypothetical protein HON43_04785 [Alphaproteobacteria bacterium]|nr:hypothetical protein [Alphaproteobacteria bacterium]MBT5389461.1 hypothetical protein [Alphaproteobacteria bacterium]MBT5540494.1 hypothetical protein [Alphaproteobacteria bacterium]